MDRNTETVILCFFGTTGGILEKHNEETQQLFPKALCTHKQHTLQHTLQHTQHTHILRAHEQWQIGIYGFIYIPKA